jgi:hypothetical protein
MASDRQLNKLPSAITTEELLKYAETQTTEVIEESSNPQNDAVKFLLNFNIKSGGYPIRKNLLYQLYRTSSTVPLKPRVFAAEVAKYIYKRQIGKFEYYLINEPSFILSKKAFKLVENKKKPRIKSPTYQKHFEAFLEHYNIKKGKTYIPFYALHYLYDKWCFKIKRKQPLGYNNLHDFFAIYFKYKRIGDSKAHVFAISNNIMEHITPDEIKEIEKSRQTKSKSKK